MYINGTAPPSPNRQQYYETKNIFLEQDKRMKLLIWDTSGMNESIFQFNNAHGVIILFDVTDRASFESVKKWIDVVR